MMPISSLTIFKKYTNDPLYLFFFSFIRFRHAVAFWDRAARFHKHRRESA